MPEYGLQVLQLKQRGHAEHAVSIKTAVRAKNMQVRMPAQEITESMYGDDCTRNGALLRNNFLEKFFQGFPCAPAEIRKQLSVVQEIPTEDFGYAENEMPVRYGLEDFLTQPFAKFHHAFLMAGWTKVAAFT